jgi:hypothetical protein
VTLAEIIATAERSASPQVRGEIRTAQEVLGAIDVLIQAMAIVKFKGKPQDAACAMGLGEIAGEADEWAVKADADGRPIDAELYRQIGAQYAARFLAIEKFMPAGEA